VIIVTRLHGASVAVNCDLIERVEATPGHRLAEQATTGQHLSLVPSPTRTPSGLDRPQRFGGGQPGGAKRRVEPGDGADGQGGQDAAGQGRAGTTTDQPRPVA
jgi:hypothetical protein